MTWAKLDDRFHSHPKVENAGLAATGLFAKALSYAACHETDGHVPDAWVRKQGGPQHARKLLDLGLWERNGSGYLIVGFLEFNPSKADLERRRQQAAEAGRLGGSAKRK